MVQERQTRVTENKEDRPLNANVRWEPHTRSMAVVEGPRTETEETQGPQGGAVGRVVGVWNQCRGLGCQIQPAEELEGMMLGEGGGGLGVRGDASHRGGSDIENAPLPVPTVVDASSVGSVCAPMLEARESCGYNTQTTFSTQRPLTVTFAGVVPQPISSDPSVTTVVSVGNYCIVGGVSQSSEGGTQQFQTSAPGGPGVTIDYAAPSLFSATCRSRGLPGSGSTAPLNSQSVGLPLSQGVDGVQYRQYGVPRSRHAQGACTLVYRRRPAADSTSDTTIC